MEVKVQITDEKLKYLKQLCQDASTAWDVYMKCYDVDVRKMHRAHYDEKADRRDAEISAFARTVLNLD